MNSKTVFPSLMKSPHQSVADNETCLSTNNLEETVLQSDLADGMSKEKLQNSQSGLHKNRNGQNDKDNEPLKDEISTKAKFPNQVEDEKRNPVNSLSSKNGLKAVKDSVEGSPTSVVPYTFQGRSGKDSNTAKISKNPSTDNSMNFNEYFVLSNNETSLNMSETKSVQSSSSQITERRVDKYFTDTSERFNSIDDLASTYDRPDNEKSSLLCLNPGKPRAFPCTICGKAFTHKTYLRVHYRIHSGIKPYRCQVCKKDFTEKNNLVTHQRVHSGEKPFQCHICRKSFAHKSNLNAHHLRNHYED